jgi:putative membrane protein
VEPDPERLGHMLGDPVAQAAEGDPIVTGIVVTVLAIVLGWLTGIVMTANRFMNFRLSLDDDKLLRRHGLLTLSEGAIPLHRVQTYILRSNPLMKFYGWYRFELQTLGIDLQQSGYQVAVPFGRLDEVADVIRAISGVEMPTRWQRVSALTIRRFIIRSTLAAGLVIGAIWWFWAPAEWALAVLPILWMYAVLRYLNMGYALGRDAVAIRRGVFRKTTWIIPYEKLQAVFRRASFFQRRLGLESFFVDTAGSSPMQPADLVDLPVDASAAIERDVYDRFVRSKSAHSAARVAGAAG